ncbi:MAG: hypothetical protein OSB69_14100 [Alphaproteobacteria bacterium]|nr:hypothetical protein [Alphaproteobacteria bacterium]
MSAFWAEKWALFGHFIGGLMAVKATLPVDRLILYEPMGMRALNPRDDVDTREREWDRTLTRVVGDAVGTEGYEAATAAFIEAWNETAWADMPAGVRAATVRNGAGLSAEIRVENDTVWPPRRLDRLMMPALLLVGDGSPPLAGRILD